MKLAEALRIRSEQSKRINQLKARIKDSAKIQEGDIAPEDPNSLLRKLEKVDFELTKLITQINLINSEITLNYPSIIEQTSFIQEVYDFDYKFEDLEVTESNVKPTKKFMCEALMERDSIKRRIEWLQYTISVSNVANNFNYSKSEIKIISLINAPSVQRTIDKLSRQLRIIV